MRGEERAVESRSVGPGDLVMIEERDRKRFGKTGLGLVISRRINYRGRKVYSMKQSVYFSLITIRSFEQNHNPTTCSHLYNFHILCDRNILGGGPV